ncbi:hypothetical protein MCUN1_001580 [Malassezia cuniculi]|uniref:Protein SYM1 n=1 Tax=Malassezia cuniculi TaxID=948313 RepID=A0AAF0EUT3_9BASI|nr:hypothetical protein MCUN1_001580 [Malassezia cuniculi]
MAAFANAYRRAFESHPWATLAATNGTMSVIADGLAQAFEYRKNVHSGADAVWDAARSGRFLVFGVGMAPLLAEWNQFIETRFPLRTQLGRVSLGALARRVAVDQIAFAPFGLALFVGSMGLMEGHRSVESLGQKFHDVYVPALLANWQVWPLIQLVNFRYMPLRLRVPFTSTCGIFWTLYLSLLNEYKEHDD